MTEDGARTILGLELGSSEDGSHWRALLRSLRERGLHGVQLVTSDDHPGLHAAVASEWGGVTWQRCTVHFPRNAVTLAPKHAQPLVSGVVRQILAPPDREAAQEQLQRAVATLQPRLPQVAAPLAHMDFPPAPWRQIRSTNGLERLHREIARRLDVVGIFPHRDAVVRLARCWSSRTTRGRRRGATSARSPWLRCNARPPPRPRPPWRHLRQRGWSW